MRILTILSAMLVSIGASASVSSVAITSFYRTSSDSQSTTAELCGQVLSPRGGDVVVVTVDPNTNPGHYLTLTSEKGSFCIVVSTRSGLAAVGLKGGATLVSSSAKVSQLPSRR